MVTAHRSQALKSSPAVGTPRTPGRDIRPESTLGQVRLRDQGVGGEGSGGKMEPWVRAQGTNGRGLWERAGKGRPVGQGEVDSRDAAPACRLSKALS